MALAPKQGLRPTVGAQSAPRVTPPAPAAQAPAAPAAQHAATVKVRCIIPNGPWTHKKRLERGEVADVPADVASLMLSRGQVEKVH